MNIHSEPDFTLDLRGESCPYPVIYTLDTLKDMPEGKLLQVITDCPSSFRNIPEEVVRRGYKMAKDPIRNGGEIFFYVIS